MNSSCTTTLATVGLLFALTGLCSAQLGATKEEIVKRYGACSPNPGGKPRGPNLYDGFIDVGSDCTSSDGQFSITTSFKADRVVGFYFSKQPTFWESVLHPFGSLYLPLSDPEISSFLRTASPYSEWLPVASDSVIRRWHTSDSSAAAYYFAGGHIDLHALIVWSASVDRVYRKVEKLDRTPQGPNHAMQPTTGRRTTKFPMTPTSPPAATHALASGG